MSEQENYEADSAADAEAVRWRNRRREKPLLSCTLCRKRKLKCDRMHPCGTCSRRGFALQCSYASTPSTAVPGTSRGKLPVPDASVHARLHQLEGLVISLMQQGNAVETNNSTIPLASPENSYSTTLSQGLEPDSLASPDLPDLGRLKLSPAKSTYVNSSHWTSILDGISDLKEQFQIEDEASVTPDVACAEPHQPPGLLLFNGCPPVSSKEEILAALPPKATTDWLISLYFEALDRDTAIIHNGQFLNQCNNKFWEDPSAAPVLWVALLFGLICVGTLSHELGEHKSRSDFAQVPFLYESDEYNMVAHYKEKLVQSLVLGDFTHGGPFVIETLVHYVSVEHTHRKDPDTGVWLAMGVLVNIAMRMGYHRDPRHFTNISPFEGEMRRRMWVSICLLDGAISAQVGMPRLIRYSHCDTSEPRNLFNSDIDENTIELPPSRPDTELTPILYLITRYRLQSIFGTVCDMLTDIRPCSDSEVMRIDRKLNETVSRVPSAYKWRPMSESVFDSATIIYHRMQIEIEYRKVQIILHLKYLLPLKNKAQYTYSRQVVIEAALKLLQYHHIVDEETKPSGKLFPVRWRFTSSLANQDFLLATVAICFYLQHNREDIEAEELEEIKRLSRRSQGIWIRASTSSTEAAKAAEGLRIILGQLDDSTATQATGENLNQDSSDYSTLIDQFKQASYPEYPSALELPFSVSYLNSMLDRTPISSTIPSTYADLVTDPTLGQIGDNITPEFWIPELRADTSGI